MAKVSPRFPMQFAQNFRLASCLSLTPCAISFSTRTIVGNFSSLMRSYAISAKTFLTFCVNFGQFSSPRWLTTVEIAAISPHVVLCVVPLEFPQSVSDSPAPTALIRLLIVVMSFCALGSAYFESFAKLVPPLDLYCHFVRFDCVKQFRSSIPPPVPLYATSFVYLTRLPSLLHRFCSHFINSRAEVTALRRVLVCQCSSICLAVNMLHTHIYICMYSCVCASMAVCHSVLLGA